MIILGIESSCDETAASLVKNGREILTNVVASSAELHQKTGGIIPEVAAREQLRCIIPVINEAIGDNIKKIDAIAITVGPGLIGSLLVGVETAKTLSFSLSIPIIPVNHLKAHLYANFLIEGNGESVTPQFPAIGLVVSGGHTDLVLIKDHHLFEHIGSTRDDAAGECFDKVARLLELGYPGGPAIAKIAETGDSSSYKLPHPMIDQDNYDFSFSGLKTAVLNLVKKEEKINRPSLAASLQQTIANVLLNKLEKAVSHYRPKSILLAGGVTANKTLRETIEKKYKNKHIDLFIPPLKLCTDNATYVASCAYYNQNPLPLAKIIANPGLAINEVIE